MSHRKRTPVFIAALLLGSMACSKKAPEGTPEGTNVDHSSVKRQSIGNCWSYAVMAFIEAQEMRARKLSSHEPQEFLNFSESYMTYRALERNIAQGEFSTTDGIQTGGSFEEAMSIIAEFGLMREADFLPNEATAVMSNAQKRAVDAINASLKSGRLKTDRSAAAIRAELDAAFGVNLASLLPKVLPADQVAVIGVDGRSVVTLKDYITRRSPSVWVTNRFPGSWTSDPNKVLTQVPYPTDPRSSGTTLLRTVKRSLNAGHPVLMSWLVEFNANDGGVFNAAILPNRNYEGHSGYHLTSLEDYTASGFDPATGVEFFVGEGPASEQMRKLAEDHGEVRAVVTKNSWGSGFDRDDRAFYLRDGVPGYHRLEMNSYLLTYLWDKDDADQRDAPSLGLQGFSYPGAMDQ